MLKLRHVRQINSTECGIACVAMLTGTGIRDARKLFPSGSAKGSKRTCPADIRKALRKKSILLGREVVTQSWDQVRRRARIALVAVNLKEDTNRDPIWHWVIYDGTDPLNCILDPASDRRRPIHNRTRLCSYFHVRGLVMDSDSRRLQSDRRLIR